MEGNQCLMSQASEDQGIDDEQVNLTPAKARSDRPRTTNGKAFEANGMLEMDVKIQQNSVSLEEGGKRTVRNASMMNDEAFRVENDQQLEAGQQSTISLEEGEKRTAQKASITDGETFEENDALETSQNSPAMPPGQYGSHSFISGHSVAVSGSTMVANNTFNIKIYHIRSSRRVRRR